jgi:hypothetical protein
MSAARLYLQGARAPLDLTDVRGGFARRVIERPAHVDRARVLRRVQRRELARQHAGFHEVTRTFAQASLDYVRSCGQEEELDRRMDALAQTIADAM